MFINVRRISAVWNAIQTIDNEANLLSQLHLTRQKCDVWTGPKPMKTLELHYPTIHVALIHWTAISPVVALTNLRTTDQHFSCFPVAPGAYVTAAGQDLPHGVEERVGWLWNTTYRASVYKSELSYILNMC